MKLEWSALAVEDRIAILDYLGQDSPRSAVVVDERIGHGVAQLIRFPEAGRPGRAKGTRELVVPRTPYVLVYRIEGSVVRILRALHGALLWPVPPG